MRLTQLQHQLEQIYEVQVPHDVEDFMFSDERMAHRLGEHTDLPNTSEQLFIHDDGENLDVSLYLEQAVMDRLHEDDPTELLHDGNLADFMTALEGVSHFVYLTWNAGFAREVSAVELELQAEVDKFIASTFLFGQQDGGRVPSRLAGWLFNEHEIDERLDDTARKRYAEANYYARKFCRALEERYLRSPTAAGLVNELRRFYRLTRWQKVQHIAANEGRDFKPFVYRH